MRLRHRRAALLATILTILLGAALASASASLLETALRLDAPPRGWARADLVVNGVEHAVLAAGEGKPAQPVTLRERSRVPDVRALITGVPGVDGIRPGATPGALVVDTAPGVDPERVKARAETALGTRPATVLTGDDRGRAEATGVAKSRLDLILVGGVFGGTELLVMAVLLAAIIGLAVTQRHREIALLRTIGATPRQVARTLRRQTLRPAVPAAVLGALLGPVLARALFERLQDKGVVPGVLQLSTSPFAVAAGALVTLLIVRACVGVAAWRAGRTPIREAVGDIEPAPGTVGRVRLALAGLCATAALSCAVTTLFMSPENAAATGGGTALAGALACAFVAPVLVDRLTRRFAGRTARLFGLPGELAAANVQARAGRSALLVIPLILVTAVALSNAYKQTTQAHGMREAYRAQVTADAVVTGDRITAREVAAARRVGPTSPLVRSQGWIEAPVDKANRIDPRGLIGLEPSAVRPQVTHGDIARLHGDAVALPEPLAADLGLTVGDRIGLVLGDGTHLLCQ